MAAGGRHRAVRISIPGPHRRATFLILGLALASVPLEAFASFPGANGKVAYAHDCRLYMVDADGSNNELIIKPPEGKCDVHPTWSPDGTKIAFVRSSQSGILYSNIHVVDLANPARPVRQLSYRRQVTESGITWAPNGAELAFSSTEAYGAGQRISVAIYSVDANGSNLRRLTAHSTTANDFTTSWSPLGDKIAFTRVAESVTRVMTLTVADGSIRALTDSDRYAEDADWSPAADRLAYVGSSGLVLMRPDGVDLTALTDVKGDSSPAWSPDGRHVAFSRGRSLVRIDTATGKVTTIVADLPYRPHGTSWQPIARPLTRLLGSLCSRVRSAGESSSKIPGVPVPPPTGPIALKLPECPSTSPVTTVIDDNTLVRTVTGSGFFRPAHKALQCLDGPITLSCAGDFIYRPTQVTEDAPDPTETTPDTPLPPLAIPDAQLGEHVTYWTIYPGKGPFGTDLEKSHESAVGALTPLLADDDAVPDATAQLLPSGSGSEIGIQLNVTTASRVLGGTPPLLVKAVFTDRIANAGNGFARTTEVAFGFDARRDQHAPLSFTGTLTKALDSDTFTAAVETSSPGAGLSLISELTQFEAETLRSTTANASFHPMPSLVRLGAAPGDLFRLEAYVSQSTVLDAHVADGPGPAITVDANVSMLPSGAQPGAILSTRSLGVSFNKNTKRLDLDTTGTVSSATLGLNQQDEHSLELNVNAMGVPSHVDLTLTKLQPKGLQAAYNASGIMSGVDVRVVDTSGLADRAEKLNLHATTLPPDIDATLGVESGDLIDAHGGVIGSIDVQLIDATSDEDAPENHIGSHGILMRDLPDHFLVAASVDGLRSLKLVRKATSAAACGEIGYSFCVEVDTAVSDSLTVDIRQLKEGRTEYVDGYLQYLPAGLTRLRFGSEPDTRLFFESAAPGGYLDLKMSMDSIENLWIILDPVPRTMRLCISGELGCAPGFSPVLPQKVVSLNVAASQRTHMQIRALELSNGDVIHGEATVKDLLFWYAKEGSDDGEIYAHTGNQELTADMNIDVSGTTAYLHFPPGFRANAQHVIFFDYGFIFSGGEIVCPDGTVANLTFLSGTIAVDLRPWLCA